MEYRILMLNATSNANFCGIPPPLYPLVFGSFLHIIDWSYSLCRRFSATEETLEQFRWSFRLPLEDQECAICWHTSSTLLVLMLIPLPLPIFSVLEACYDVKIEQIIADAHWVCLQTIVCKPTWEADFKANANYRLLYSNVMFRESVVHSLIV